MQHIEIGRFLEVQNSDPSPPMIRWEMLRRMMEHQDLSYPALAKASGTPESTLRKLLQGVTKDPRISTMLPVVIALGASFDRLLGLAPSRDFNHNDAAYDVAVIDSIRQNVDAMQARLEDKQEMIKSLESECTRLRKMYNEKCIDLSAAEARMEAMKAEVIVGETRGARSDKVADDLRQDVEKLQKTLGAERQDLRKMRILCVFTCIGLVAALLVVVYLTWEITNPDLGLFKFERPA